MFGEFVLGVLTGGLGFFYFWGVRSGGAGNPSTVSSPAGTDATDCREACSAWDNARQMLCSAKADEVAARSRADGIRGQVAVAIAAATALTAAGVAAAVAAAAATATFFGIPAGIVLAVIAAALFAAAVVSWAVASFLAGELTSAEADVGAKASVRQNWDAAVASARAAVNTMCDPAEANACLSRSAPC